MAGPIGRLILLSILTGVMAWAPLAAARTPQHPPLSAADRAAALERIKAEIASTYVFPDRRGPAIDRLAAAAAQGRYDTPDPAVFAERVTEDLTAATRDTHLYLQHDPAWFASASLPAQPGEDAQQIALEAEIARHTNHGLTEMRILPVNYAELLADPVSGADRVARFLGEPFNREAAARTVRPELRRQKA